MKAYKINHFLLSLQQKLSKTNLMKADQQLTIIQLSSLLCIMQRENDFLQFKSEFLNINNDKTLDITQCEFYKRAVLFFFFQITHILLSDFTDNEFSFLSQIQILRLSSQKTVYEKSINETMITLIITF